MELDDAYANAAHIPGGEGYPARWQADAAAFRQEGRRQRLDLPYGPQERERFDLFLPDATPAGLIVFVHGGFWRAFDRTFWSHFAAGPLGRGWAVAMPSYTLCPGARIGAITRQIAAAVTAAAREVPGPVVVTGHSAGGHLSARMACQDLSLPVDLRRVVPISPLSDLRPLMRTGMNADLRIDDAEAAAESPVFLTPRAGIGVASWVGGAERPAFLDQSRWLREAWGCSERIEGGRHHFDILDLLLDPGSALVADLVG